MRNNKQRECSRILTMFEYSEIISLFFDHQCERDEKVYKDTLNSASDTLDSTSNTLNSTSNTLDSTSQADTG